MILLLLAACTGAVEVALVADGPTPAFALAGVSLRPEGLDWEEPWTSLELVESEAPADGLVRPLVVAAGLPPAGRYEHVFIDVIDVDGALDIVEPTACPVEVGGADRRLVVELLVWPEARGPGLFAAGCRVGR